MISVDTVYQRVLALANKEQRGYITPQEFNLLADHAQKEIFEQYFYDLNQFKRAKSTNHEYTDAVTNIGLSKVGDVNGCLRDCINCFLVSSVKSLLLVIAP